MPGTSSPAVRFPFARRSLLAAIPGLALPMAGSRSAEPRRGGVLKISTIGLDTSDFHRHTGSIGVVQVMAETLTSIAADGSTIPFLATSWSISDDGRTYRFSLRQGVRFHNGRAMTAQDIAANVARIRDKVKGGWLTSTFKTVADMETPDPHTFVLRLTEPFSPLLGLLAEMWIMSPDSPGWEGNISQPICTGPFTFGTWEPQVKLLAPAFRDYWVEGRPYVDALQFDLGDVADPSLALRSGDYHIAGIEANKVDTVARDPRTAVVYRHDTGWWFWSFNNRKPRPPFDDVRVRRAIGHAMNKVALASIAGGPAAVPGNQMVAPGSAYFSAELAAQDAYAKPDLAAARQLLADAKVDPAAVTVNAVIQQGDRFAPPSTQMLRQLGFNVATRAYDDLGYQRALSAYDWDFFPSSSGPRTDVFLRYVRLTSDGPNPGLWGGIQDPELDATIHAAVAAPDLDGRRADYVQAMRHVLDRAYFLPVFHARGAYGVRKEVTGFTPGFTYSLHGPDYGVAGAWLAA